MRSSVFRRQVNRARPQPFSHRRRYWEGDRRLISAPGPSLPLRPSRPARPSIARPSTHPTVDHVGSSFGQRQVSPAEPGGFPLTLSELACSRGLGVRTCPADGLGGMWKIACTPSVAALDSAAAGRGFYDTIALGSAHPRSTPGARIYAGRTCRKSGDQRLLFCDDRARSAYAIR